MILLHHGIPYFGHRQRSWVQALGAGFTARQFDVLTGVDSVVYGFMPRIDGRGTLLAF